MLIRISFRDSCALKVTRRCPSHCIRPALLIAICLLPLWANPISAQQTQEQLLEIAHQVANLNLDGAKLEAKGDIDGAVALFFQALALSQKNFGPNDPLTGLSLNTLGRGLTNKGEYANAVKVLELAAKNFAGAGELGRTGVAQAKHDLAMAYDYLNDYSHAQPLYEQALALDEEIYGPESREVARSLNDLANLYREKADLARAEAMLERSLAIRRKLYGAHHPLIGVMLNNLGAIYESQGNNTKAEEFFTQAIAIAEKQADPENIGLANFVNNLGVLVRADDPKRARPLIERGLALREKILGPKDPDVGISLNNLAMLDAQEGNVKTAEQLLLRALKIQQDAFGPAHPYVTRVLANLAFLSLSRGDTKRAIGLLADNGDIGDRNLELMLATGSEEQKRLYMATLADGTSANVSIHLQSAPDDPAAARLALTQILRRKGRVLDVMSGQIASVAKSDAAGQAMLVTLAGVRAQLSSAVLRGPEDDNLERYKTGVARLQEQVQNLERLISERVTAAGDRRGAVTIENVQAAIPADAVLIEMIQYRPMTITSAVIPRWGAPHYAAYLLRRTGPPVWADLGDAARIDQDLSRLRAALRNPRSTAFPALARMVDDEVMRPLRKLMGNTRQVLLSPDGGMNLVPFAALIDETNHYLVETYAFSYLTSGRDLLRLSDHLPSRQGPVVIANPLFDRGAKENPIVRESAPESAKASLRSASFGETFVPLEGTAGEARDVATVLSGASVFTGEQATESVVKQLKAPSILHIATHGFFLKKNVQTQPEPAGQTGAAVLRSENPLLRAGIALSGANQLNDGHGDDGILTALEASGLDLHGTKLVVLSACETGVGEVQNGEGVYGLRRALVLAGAESQLMSLWKVDDDATRELMVNFYRQLQAGKGRAAALREVQLQLLKTDYKHPFFWAGFILSGNWEPIVTQTASGRP